MEIERCRGCANHFTAAKKRGNGPKQRRRVNQGLEVWPKGNGRRVGVLESGIGKFIKPSHISNKAGTQRVSVALQQQLISAGIGEGLLGAETAAEQEGIGA